MSLLAPFLLLFCIFQLQIWQANAKSGQCLESKCRGTRVHPWVDNDLEITCWIPLDADEKDPSFCAEGYVGHIVPDVPHEMVDGEWRAWYTCCESDFDGVAQQTCKYSACSSPDWASGGNCWADGFQEPMSCGDSTYRHPHLTSQKSLIYFQFICCDTPQDGPEAQELLISRGIWITLSSITLVVCTIFVVAILGNKEARSEGWNLYLVFLAIPDAFCNLMIIIRNSLTIPGVPVNPSIHIMFASVEYFYAAANLWLNAVIIAQVYYVLRKSSPQRTIPPPSTKLVVQQSLAVYLLAMGAFGWAYYMYARGLIDYSLDTVVNIWISTRALLVLPPLLFCIWVCFHVWWKDLLPKRGRTRVLSLYFLRVIVVFLVTWIPYFILYEVSWNITFSTWMVNISYYLSSIQGTISVVVALSKPDVGAAVLALVCCGRGDSKKTAIARARPPREDIETCVSAPSTTYEEPNKAYNEWYDDDDWGHYDLDNIMNGVDSNDNAPEQAPASTKNKPRIMKSTLSTSTASKGEGEGEGETFDDDNESSTAEDDDKPKTVEAPKVEQVEEPKVEENYVEWIDNFMERFRLKQELALQQSREI